MKDQELTKEIKEVINKLNKDIIEKELLLDSLYEKIDIAENTNLEDED